MHFFIPQLIQTKLLYTHTVLIFDSNIAGKDPYFFYTFYQVLPIDKILLSYFK